MKLQVWLLMFLILLVPSALAIIDATDFHTIYGNDTAIFNRVNVTGYNQYAGSVKIYPATGGIIVQVGGAGANSACFYTDGISSLGSVWFNVTPPVNHTGFNITMTYNTPTLFGLGPFFGNRSVTTTDLGGQTIATMSGWYGTALDNTDRIRLWKYIGGTRSYSGTDNAWSSKAGDLFLDVNYDGTNWYPKFYYNGTRAYATWNTPNITSASSGYFNTTMDMGIALNWDNGACPTAFNITITNFVLMWKGGTYAEPAQPLNNYSVSWYSNSTNVTSYNYTGVGSFNINWTSGNATGKTIAYSIFSTNNTGDWANATAQVGTGNYSRLFTDALTLNQSQANFTVGYKWFANSSDNLWNVTDTFILTKTNTTTIYPPTWSSLKFNNSVVKNGANIQLWVNWTGTATGNLSYYIFSSNNTGTWANTTYAYATSTYSQNTTVNITYNGSNSAMGYKWFANTTEGMWNVTNSTTLAMSGIFIHTCSEFHNYTNNGEGNDSTYYIMNNIDCTSMGNWYDAGKISFSGNLFGQGHTIANINYSCDSGCYSNNNAIFGTVYAGNISQIKFVNITIRQSDPAYGDSSGIFIGSVEPDAGYSCVYADCPKLWIDQIAVVDSSIYDRVGQFGGCSGFIGSKNGYGKVTVNNSYLRNVKVQCYLDMYVGGMFGYVSNYGYGAYLNLYNSYIQGEYWVHSGYTDYGGGGVAGAYAVLGNVFSLATWKGGATPPGPYLYNALCHVGNGGDCTVGPDNYWDTNITKTYLGTAGTAIDSVNNASQAYYWTNRTKGNNAPMDKWDTSIWRLGTIGYPTLLFEQFTPVGRATVTAPTTLNVVDGTNWSVNANISWESDYPLNRSICSFKAPAGTWYNQSAIDRNETSYYATYSCGLNSTQTGDWQWQQYVRDNSSYEFTTGVKHLLVTYNVTKPYVWGVGHTYKYMDIDMSTPFNSTFLACGGAIVPTNYWYSPLNMSQFFYSYAMYGVWTNESTSYPFTSYGSTFFSDYNMSDSNTSTNASLSIPCSAMSGSNYKETVEFYVYANDTFNNFNRSQYIVFWIVNNSYPYMYWFDINQTPYVGGALRIYFNMTATSNLSHFRMQETMPNGTKFNWSVLKFSDYNCTATKKDCLGWLDGTPSPAGMHTVSVWANDTNGFQSFSDEILLYTYALSDLAPNVTISLNNTVLIDGGGLLINGSISTPLTGNTVSHFFVSELFPNGTWVNYTAGAVNASKIYESAGAVTPAGWHTVKVYANDSQNYMGVSATRTFKVVVDGLNWQNTTFMGSDMFVKQGFSIWNESLMDDSITTTELATSTYLLDWSQVGQPAYAYEMSKGTFAGQESPLYAFVLGNYTAIGWNGVDYNPMWYVYRLPNLTLKATIPYYGSPNVVLQQPIGLGYDSIKPVFFPNVTVYNDTWTDNGMLYIVPLQNTSDAYQTWFGYNILNWHNETGNISAPPIMNFYGGVDTGAILGSTYAYDGTQPLLPHYQRGTQITSACGDDRCIIVYGGLDYESLTAGDALITDSGLYAVVINYKTGAIGTEQVLDSRPQTSCFPKNGNLVTDDWDNDTVTEIFIPFTTINGVNPVTYSIMVVSVNGATVTKERMMNITSDTPTPSKTVLGKIFCGDSSGSTSVNYDYNGNIGSWMSNLLVYDADNTKAGNEVVVAVKHDWSPLGRYSGQLDFRMIEFYNLGLDAYGLTSETLGTTYRFHPFTGLADDQYYGNMSNLVRASVFQNGDHDFCVMGYGGKKKNVLAEFDYSLRLMCGSAWNGTITSQMINEITPSTLPFPVHQFQAGGYNHYQDMIYSIQTRPTVVGGINRSEFINTYGSWYLDGSTPNRILADLSFSSMQPLDPVTFKPFDYSNVQPVWDRFSYDLLFTGGTRKADNSTYQRQFLTYVDDKAGAWAPNITSWQVNPCIFYNNNRTAWKNGTGVGVLVTATLNSTIPDTWRARLVFYNENPIQRIYGAWSDYYTSGNSAYVTYDLLPYITSNSTWLIEVEDAYGYASNYTDWFELNATTGFTFTDMCVTSSGYGYVYQPVPPNNQSADLGSIFNNLAGFSGFDITIFWLILILLVTIVMWVIIPEPLVKVGGIILVDAAMLIFGMAFHFISVLMGIMVFIALAFIVGIFGSGIDLKSTIRERGR